MSEFQKIEIIDSQNGKKLKVAFALFPNDKRGDNARAPNSKGFDRETGVLASGWTREGNSGKFISGSLEIPLDKIPGYGAASRQPDAQPAQDDFNDPIPF